MVRTGNHVFSTCFFHMFPPGLPQQLGRLPPTLQRNSLRSSQRSASLDVTMPRSRPPSCPSWVMGTEDTPPMVQCRGGQQPPILEWKQNSWENPKRVVINYVSIFSILFGGCYMLLYVWYHEDWTKPPRSVTLRIILWLGLSLGPFESWNHWLQRKKEGPDGQKDSWVVLFTFPLGQADSSVPFHVFHSMCVFWTVMVASHSNWHGAKCFKPLLVRFLWRPLVRHRFNLAIHPNCQWDCHSLIISSLHPHELGWFCTPKFEIVRQTSLAHCVPVKPIISHILAGYMYCTHKGPTIFRSLQPPFSDMPISTIHS
jgi:hypothetical protein